MKRRHFCGLGLAGMTVLPTATAAFATGGTGTPQFSNLVDVVRQELPRETLANLRLLGQAMDRAAGLAKHIEHYHAQIAEDFRVGRIVKPKGVHLSQTEAALILHHAEVMS